MADNKKVEVNLRKSSGTGKVSLNLNLNLTLPEHPTRFFALWVQGIFFLVFGLYHLYHLQNEGAVYLPLVLLTHYAWRRRQELPDALRQVLWWYFFSVRYLLLLIISVTFRPGTRLTKATYLFSTRP
jgi:hypothetical protein